MPTTKTQSMLVYALNVLLLFNLTVIAVLLSEADAAPNQPTPQLSASDPREPRQADSEPGTSDTPRQPVVREEIEAPLTEAIAAEVVQAGLTQDVAPQPFALVAPAVLDDDIIVEVNPQPAAQDDPPVTFFGVGLD